MSLSSPSLLYDYCKIEELVLSASQKILEQVRKRKEWHPLLQDRIANIGKELGLKVQIRAAGIPAEAHREVRKKRGFLRDKAAKLEFLIDQYALVMDRDEDFALTLMG